MKPKATGFSRIIKATGYSLQGLVSAWKSEAAFRQEATMGIFLIPVAIWIGDSAVEVALLLLTALLVPLVELLNSAIEAVVDRVGDEPHYLSANAKDMGSAAVFVSIVLMVIVWSVVLFY